MSAQTKSLVAKPGDSKRYWVWVTGEDHYDFLGDDAWWTCHADSMPGDPVVLYRTSPKQDLSHVLEVKSKARIHQEPRFDNSISLKTLLRRLSNIDGTTKHASGNDLSMTLRQAVREMDHLYAKDDYTEAAAQALEERFQSLGETALRLVALPKTTSIDLTGGEFEGDYVCDYKVRLVLANPLPLRTMKSDPLLMKHWGALRAGFRQRAYEVPQEVWEHLLRHFQTLNPKAVGSLRLLEAARVSADILSENELETRLVDRLEALRPHYDLELFVDSFGRSGRQYPCDVGYIDLLCKDRKTKRMVVVELKIGRAGRDAVSQIASYMGWVEEHLSPRRPVEAVVISDGHDRQFQYAARQMKNLRHLELRPIQERLRP